MTPGPVSAAVSREAFTFVDAEGTTVYGVGGCDKTEVETCGKSVLSWDAITLAPNTKGGRISTSVADAPNVPLNKAAYAARPTGHVYEFGGQRTGGLSSILGHLYLNQGTQQWTWEAVATTGEVVAAREMATLTAVGNVLVLFGGSTVNGATDDLYFLSTTAAGALAANQWAKPTIAGPKPSARLGHSATLYKNVIYIFGGYTSDNVASDALFTLTVPLDPATAWTWASPAKAGAVAAMPTPRARHAAFVLGDSLYVLPGVNENLKPVSGVSVLDIANGNTWVATEPGVQAVPATAGRSAVVALRRTRRVAVIVGGSSPVDYTRPSFLDFRAVCSNTSCGIHGTYNETNNYPRCDCATGYKGKFCNVSVVCPCAASGFTCDANGACICPLGFGGADCSQAVCPNNCTDPTRGSCSKTCVALAVSVRFLFSPIVSFAQ